MSIFDWLLGKKKKEESDGQEEYFKEDFAPVIKRSAEKKADSNQSEEETNKKSNIANKPVEKVEKKTAPVSRVERKVVKPTPRSERIINPSEKSEKVVAPEVKTQREEKPVAKPEAPKPVNKPEKVNAVPSTTRTYEELNEESPELKGAVAVQESKSTANGKFDIQKAKDGRYFFTLYASNAVAIAHSQLYSSTGGATTGINSIIANSQKAGIEDTTLKKPTSLPCPKWEIYLDKAGEFRFRLYAPNGQCVCHSAHGYATKAGCKGGMESIKRFSAEAKVDKSYLK